MYRDRYKSELETLWRYGGLRFKQVFPTYEIFLEKTTLTDFPENLYETTKNVYGNHYLSRMSEQDAIGYVKWNFGNSLKMYNLILKATNKPYEELIREYTISKGSNFNPKNIDLNLFAETDNSFLNNFAKTITERNRQPLTIINDIIDNYTTAENTFLNLIKISFSASRDFQPINFEFNESGC